MVSYVSAKFTLQRIYESMEALTIDLNMLPTWTLSIQFLTVMEGFLPIQP